jgi:methylphosphotriester-DNA--protein-cysteine methyltransferase
MLYLTHAPRPPLSKFVELFWFYEGYSQTHAKERIMPDGSMQIVINLLEDELKTYHPESPERFEKFSGALFAGPRSGFGVIDTASQASLIGIHFKPGGALPLLNMPLGELRNQSLSLECLWGPRGKDVRDRVLEAPTPEAKMRTFERCLQEQALRPFDRHPAVSRALRLIETSLPVSSVGALASEIGISRRRFIQVFSDETGLTPKLFCRIRRFQRVLRDVQNCEETNIDWTDVALGHGYFDQAHFNHDFRTFSGITPGAYLKHRTQHLNHVPLID